MTPSEIKAALAQLGGYANKRLGQHFLIDKNVLKTIVDTADIKRGDRVLEIGPGLGVLTRALVERGAEVIAIEQDRRFVEFLDSRLRENDIHVVQGDAAAV
ncbi:methyltransferase domain-containing protein, partial [Patescibacteria group bacterium]|nr:methyltransferase domain-containing protein [Patescibacteria group bacterium]MBU1629732.1 methyltransferase domain-containing protein [Patescibacteria group bacterium]MBU1907528.1 methyltransferase domain-containing protein [Patescibacteria group bacterium]